MADEKKLALAKEVYTNLYKSIDSRGWSYDKEEDALIAYFTVRGEDLPMRFILVVDIDRQLIRLLSPLPFKMSESKRMDGAIAACVASYGMIDGSFDFDISDGTVMFRMTASFRESTIGDGLFKYMIDCSAAMVDKYNDRFLALEKGFMSISDFMAKD
ncbi:MAG: YbjN domain-containing protein [Oscillospiraceae bacterium]|nr:YbjN domain-containing protein [Oscillospiraceae bacterium]